MPESIVSDQDAKFTSSFWKELHQLMETKRLMSTSFRPQTDDATERANRSIGQVLWAMVCNDKKDWAELCPMVEFTLNSSISAMTRYAPFELNCGYIPLLRQHISIDTKYAQTFQSLRYPFKGVSQKCTEPLVYGWAEIYQPPFAADGPRNIMHLRSAWAKPACQCIYIHSPS